MASVLPPLLALFQEMGLNKMLRTAIQVSASTICMCVVILHIIIFVPWHSLFKMCYIVFSFKKITLVYFDCIPTYILPVNVTWMSSLRHFFVPQRIFSHIFNTKVVVCVAHEGDIRM